MSEVSLSPSEPITDRATANSSTVSGISASRITVNRANAQHSTGPRTEAGKARSRWNALTHGLYARTLSQSAQMLGQDLADYEALRDALMEDYAPEGVAEERMIERMAQHCWRQDRLFIHTERQLVADLEEGDGAVGVCLHAERMEEAETKLDRSISRIHRDLLFLARYRARTAELIERQQDRREQTSFERQQDRREQTNFERQRVQIAEQPHAQAQQASEAGTLEETLKGDVGADCEVLPSASEPPTPQQEIAEPPVSGDSAAANQGEIQTAQESPAQPADAPAARPTPRTFVDPLARFFRPAPPIGSKEWYESIRSKPTRGGSEAGAPGASTPG